MTTTKNTQLTRDEIINALEANDYVIDTARECFCGLEIDRHGARATSDECWYVTTLSVSGELIAQFNNETGELDYWHGVGHDDIPEDILSELRENELPHDGDLHDHDDYERMAARYIEEHAVTFWFDVQRGFANEWRLVICEDSLEAQQMEDWGLEELEDVDLVASYIADAMPACRDNYRQVLLARHWH